MLNTVGNIGGRRLPDLPGMPDESLRWRRWGADAQAVVRRRCSTGTGSGRWRRATLTALTIHLMLGCAAIN